jgi:hypothetical protein
MQDQNDIDGFKASLTALSAAMAVPKSHGKDSPIAQRAIRLRKAFGYDTATGFAKFLGVSVQRWSNVENGLPLGSQLALIVVRKVPGLTMDWLYLGKPDGLPMALARRLGELEPSKTSNTGL